MEAMGVVERVPDPEDGRARLVRFTKAGRKALLDGISILRGLEAELARAIGDGEMKALHRALAALLVALETGG
jgi:DNA-binding MarR family transcriptional regulator